MSGTAPDGGLYVPEKLPHFEPDALMQIDTISNLAEHLMGPFFEGSTLKNQLQEICDEAFSFPVRLQLIENTARESLSVLELFHGPTAAFKDFGARFLAACMTRTIGSRQGGALPVTVVVATSGDTGSAVAAAFHRRPGVRVVVLFPDGKVSPRQQHQLTCWGENVISLAVRGRFDDCQHLAKEMFADAGLVQRYGLCSANSINVGRLLPQSVYYAQASLANYRKNGKASSFIIPTGNLGNAFAGIWAKQMGLPIDQIILATNANRTISDFLESGEWKPRASVPTLASAMDVGDPSNMERLRNLCGDAADIGRQLRAISVSDEQIAQQIAKEHSRNGLAWCPHTATAFNVYRNLSDDERAKHDFIIIATAHAAKFENIVEPLIGGTINPPDELARLLQWPARFESINSNKDEITSRLQ